MGRPAIDLAGQRFGRLTAVERFVSANREQWWRCVCDCGRRVSVRRCSLRRGATKSCGCLRSERAAARKGMPRRWTKHGDSFRDAAVRLSQEIGPLRAALALGVDRNAVSSWRRRAGLPRLKPFSLLPEPKCQWCGDTLEHPGLCAPPAPCRAEYLADVAEEGGAP